MFFLFTGKLSLKYFKKFINQYFDGTCLHLIEVFELIAFICHCLYLLQMFSGCLPCDGPVANVVVPVSQSGFIVVTFALG